MQWIPDPHGALTLELSTPFGQTSIWINARQTYCDRGHWQWGWQGGALGGSGVAEPSYYFMTQENARNEIEAWLAQVLGAKLPGPADMAERSPMRDLPGNAGWQRDSDTLVAHVSTPQGPGLARIEAKQGAEFGFYKFTVEGIEADDADRFPRFYASLDTAIDEAERFLAWRLLEVPSEIPGPIRGEPVPVGDQLKSAQSSPRIAPRARRP